jgi:hypothetical protein
MKIRLVTADFFHAYGQASGETDVMKLIVAFLNFAKSPTNTTTSLGI